MAGPRDRHVQIDYSKAYKNMRDGARRKEGRKVSRLHDSRDPSKVERSVHPRFHALRAGDVVSSHDFGTITGLSVRRCSVRHRHAIPAVVPQR